MFDMWQGVIKSIQSKTAFKNNAFGSFEQKPSLCGLWQDIQACSITQGSFEKSS
jgi:hypothetical protein